MQVRHHLRNFSYFNKKITDGHYKDIYTLLVDFTMMMYRKGAFSIDLNLPSFNSTITYINKYIKAYWIHSCPSNELVSKFDLMWKKAKPATRDRAISAFKIPCKITKGGIFLLEDINKEETDNNLNNESTEEIESDNFTAGKDLIVPHIYGVNEVETKLSSLFDYSETNIWEENKLIEEIKILLFSHAWENIYDFFGDIQYILYTQHKIAKNRKRIIFNKLKDFESKHRLFFSNFKKSLHLDNRQEARKSFRNVWFGQYTITHITKMAIIFEVIDKIDKYGKIYLKIPIIGTTKKIESTSSSSSESIHDEQEEMNHVVDEGTNTHDDSMETPQNNSEDSAQQELNDTKIDSTENTEAYTDEMEVPEKDISVQINKEEESDDHNIDSNEEDDDHEEIPEEYAKLTSQFDSEDPIREDVYGNDDVATELLLSDFYDYLKNNNISEARIIIQLLMDIFKLYYLDIQESFDNVNTKGELFEAYQQFKKYTAINFIPNRQKEKLMNAFKYYIYYLLEVNIKQLH